MWINISFANSSNILSYSFLYKTNLGLMDRFLPKGDEVPQILIIILK